MVIQNPIKAIKVNDTLKLVAPAIRPITGGPNKKPRKPIVDTADNAVPADNTFDFPATLYTSGTTEETPKPTKKNPKIAVIKWGKITAISNPAAVNEPLN